MANSYVQRKINIKMSCIFEEFCGSDTEVLCIGKLGVFIDKLMSGCNLESIGDYFNPMGLCLGGKDEDTTVNIYRLADDPEVLVYQENNDYCSYKLILQSKSKEKLDKLEESIRNTVNTNLPKITASIQLGTESPEEGIS